MSITIPESKENFQILRRRFKQNANMKDCEKYRFYGHYYPQFDEFIFKRYFPDTSIQGVYIECGANNGNAGSNCKFFEETLHWAGYNLEPTPIAFEQLEQNRPKARNINAALSDRTGFVDFVIFECLIKGNKYFGYMNRAVNDQWIKRERERERLSQGYKVKDIISVPCLTWRDLIEQERISCVDLFVLDTEGHEEQVIDGMTGCPVLPQIMCVENGWNGRIREKLDSMGYFYDITHYGNHMYVRKDILPLVVLRGLHKNV